MRFKNRDVLEGLLRRASCRNKFLGLKANHDLETTQLSPPSLGLEPWAACSWSMIQ